MGRTLSSLSLSLCLSPSLSLSLSSSSSTNRTKLNTPVTKHRLIPNHYTDQCFSHCDHVTWALSGPNADKRSCFPRMSTSVSQSLNLIHFLYPGQCLFAVWGPWRLLSSSFPRDHSTWCSQVTPDNGKTSKEKSYSDVKIVVTKFKLVDGGTKLRPPGRKGSSDGKHILLCAVMHEDWSISSGGRNSIIKRCYKATQPSCVCALMSHLGGGHPWEEAYMPHTAAQVKRDVASVLLSVLTLEHSALACIGGALYQGGLLCCGGSHSVMLAYSTASGCWLSIAAVFSSNLHSRNFNSWISASDMSLSFKCEQRVSILICQRVVSTNCRRVKTSEMWFF